MVDARLPCLDAVEIDARAETARHWGRIHDYLVALFTHQGLDAVVAEELALLPGAEEITTLLAIEEHARERGYEVVIVDCAPTDAARRLVSRARIAHRELRLRDPLADAGPGIPNALADSLYVR